LEKKQEVFQLYKNGLKGLESIENQYIKSDLDNKRRLIGSIFPENFQFENKKVRTTDINPILDKIAQFNRVNRKNKKRDKSKKEDLSRCVLEAGLEPARPQWSLDFKSNVSTNSTTRAWTLKRAKDGI
jgi:site-specific DNA recombinase